MLKGDARTRRRTLSKGERDKHLNTKKVKEKSLINLIILSNLRYQDPPSQSVKVGYINPCTELTDKQTDRQTE